MNVRMIQILSMVLIGIFGSFVLKAQQSDQKLNKNTSVEIAEPFNIEDYSEFKKISFGQFSIYVPNEFKVEIKRGIEGGSWSYSDKNVEVNIYQGSYSPVPSSSQEKLRGYSEKKVFVNQIYTWIWFYENAKDDYNYVAGINFKLKNNKGNTVTVILKSKDPESKKIAEQIFSSIKFNEIGN